VARIGGGNSEADSAREILPHSLQQFYGIQRTAWVFLMLEESVGLQPVSHAFLHATHELLQVGRTVLRFAKPKVNVLRRLLFRSRDLFRFSDAQRNIALPEHSIGLVRKPCRVSKFKCRLHTAGQLGEKIAKPRNIGFKRWRQLKQYRAKLLTERLQCRQKSLQCSRILQLANVGNELIGFLCCAALVTCL